MGNKKKNKLAPKVEEANPADLQAQMSKLQSLMESFNIMKQETNIEELRKQVADSKTNETVKNSLKNINDASSNMKHLIDCLLSGKTEDSIFQKEYLEFDKNKLFEATTKEKNEKLQKIYRQDLNKFTEYENKMKELTKRCGDNAEISNLISKADYFRELGVSITKSNLDKFS